MTTETTRERARRMKAEGHKVRDIAAALGVTRQAVYLHLGRELVREYRKRPKTCEERQRDRERLIDLVRRGHPISRAARRYRVDVGTAGAWCLEAGVDAPMRLIATKRDAVGVLADLILTADSMYAIAEKRHVTQTYVNTVLQRARREGIPVHPARGAGRTPRQA